MPNVLESLLGLGFEVGASILVTPHSLQSESPVEPEAQSPKCKALSNAQRPGETKTWAPESAYTSGDSS